MPVAIPWKLIFYLGLAAVIAGGYLYIRALRAEKEVLTEQRDQARRDLQEETAALVRLQKAKDFVDKLLGERERQRAQLEKERGQLNARIRDLLEQDDAAKKWADGVVPDSLAKCLRVPAECAARNRERPAPGSRPAGLPGAGSTYWPAAEHRTVSAGAGLQRQPEAVQRGQGHAAKVARRPERRPEVIADARAHPP
jgi:hypothetical protein